MMPDPEMHEAESIAAAEPSRILWLGKDEMNLAEFPITLLADRIPKDQWAIQYQDQLFEEKTGRLITRTLTIKATANEETGLPELPTAVDDDVILGLIQLTKMANNFSSREVEFNRLDLLRVLDWPDSGFSYKRLATSLKRWLGVTLIYENAWWDKKQQRWTTKGFHIIDNFELNNGRTVGQQGELFPSKVIWNKAVFDSFQSGYLKSLDYELYRRLKHPTAKRMYRFLSKRMYHRPDWTFELKDLAFEHIGLSRSYSGNAGKVKEKLQPAIEELEEAGFLVPVSKEARYQKEGKTWKIRLEWRTKPAALPLAPPEAGASPLVAELCNRDIARAKAVALVQQHPAEAITLHLEVFDWLIEKKDRRVAKNPAGFLFQSILENYSPPKGFLSKAEQQKREQTRRQAERRAIEEQRRRQEQAQAERAEEERLDAYWQSLTPDAQAELDVASRALADPKTLAMEQAGPAALQRLGQRIRRNAYIRQLLTERGEAPTSQKARNATSEARREAELF